jgi:hypothetical protein
MIVITSLEDLYQNKEFITQCCENNGIIWNHNFLYYEAKFIHNKNFYHIFINKEPEIICSLEEKTDNIWQSDINGSPLIYSKDICTEVIKGFFDEIINFLNVQALYFPLVYEIFPLYEKLKGEVYIKSWERLPNPMISGNITYENIYEEFKRRIKSKSIENSRIKYKNKFSIKTESIEHQLIALKSIELKSWKRVYKQDMMSREDQFNYYSKLIENGVLKFNCIYDDDIPVAYSIETLYKDVLYLIKWSYNEEYKKYSPGRNLCLDRLEFYNQTQLKYVDLYGGPDGQKDLLESERVKRFDFSYPNLDIVNSIMEERISHDEIVMENYLNGKSIRYAYNKE